MKDKSRVIIVDDEVDFENIYRFAFEDEMRTGTLEVSYYNCPLKCISDLNIEDLNNNCLLITDINMPKMDGIELINSLRLHNKNLPVIVNTAYPQLLDRAEYKDLKIEKIFHKPTSLQMIKDYAVEVLNRNDHEVT